MNVLGTLLDSAENIPLAVTTSPYRISRKRHITIKSHQNIVLKLKTVFSTLKNLKLCCKKEHGQFNLFHKIFIILFVQYMVIMVKAEAVAGSCCGSGSATLSKPKLNAFSNENESYFVRQYFKIIVVETFWIVFSCSRLMFLIGQCVYDILVHYYTNNTIHSVATFSSF
jgi:hypothetical protein